jgi:sulfite exporter TauE/SafE
MDILIVSTLTVALLHALAPDHWLPFVMLGRAQRWSPWKLTGITSLAGLGHVSSSLLIGAIGVLVGMAAEKINLLESHRGSIASLLLIGFGLAYMVWGIKNWGRKHTHEMKNANVVSYWTLFALVVFGPCEPLIPLIFVGYGFGWMVVLAVFAVFGIATIAMMLVQVHLASAGMRLLRAHWLEHGSHAIAGGVIALTGVAIMVLGL